MHIYLLCLSEFQECAQGIFLFTTRCIKIIHACAKMFLMKHFKTSNKTLAMRHMRGPVVRPSEIFGNKPGIGLSPLKVRKCVLRKERH